MDLLLEMLWNDPLTGPLVLLLGIWFCEWALQSYEQRARYDLPVLINADDIHLQSEDLDAGGGE